MSTEIVEEVHDVVGFLDGKTFVQVATFVIAAIIILLVALIWNDTLVITFQTIFGESIWWRIAAALIISVIAIIVVYFSRIIYKRHDSS